MDELKNLLDEERRKSLADEGLVRKIEAELQKKMKEANDFNRRVN